MRKTLLLLAISACPFVNILAQQWYNAASISDYRMGALGFAIGDYGYCGMGSGSSNFVDLWQYDPMANTWTQVATPPNGARTGGFSFTIDSFAYVGLGNASTDCWKYNGFTNQWMPIDSFPSAPRNCPAFFTIGNCGYVGTGSDSRDFWKYEVATDNWTQIDSFPGTGRREATSFAINGNGYVGLGANGSWNAFNDFWKYDTTLGWVALNPFPGTTRNGAKGLALLNKGYVCAGVQPPWYYNNEFWEYDPSFDYWTPLTQLPGSPRKLMCGFVVDSTAFFGTGMMSGFDPPPYFFNDFFKFSFSILMDVHEEEGMNLAISVLNEDFIVINSTTELNRATVRLYSMQGEEIYIKEMTGTQCQLEISELADGVYVVMVETSTKQFTRKVLIH